MRQRDISAADAFALRQAGIKMKFPYGVRSPNGDLGMSRAVRETLGIEQPFDTFDPFNAYAMTEEGQFADHPQIVKQLASMLRDDPEAADTFIEGAQEGIEMTFKGILLTRNDIEQIRRII